MDERENMKSFDKIVMDRRSVVALGLGGVATAALAGCAGGNSGSSSASSDGASGGSASGDFKVGFICLHDENSTYDLNFINGA